MKGLGVRYIYYLKVMIFVDVPHPAIQAIKRRNNKNKLEVKYCYHNLM